MQIPSYLLNTHYNDRYFDVVNAVHEAKQVFFKGTFLLEKLHYSLKDPKQISIGETGFGPGRNLLSLIDYLKDSELDNILITYNTCELHPVSTEQMAAILECFREQVGDNIDQVVSLYNRIDTSVPGWHHEELELPFGKIAFNLWIGEALDMVKALENPCDIWFLDGHGPKTNPQIWRRELLLAIGEKTCSGGTCATYTVAGDVKRALAEAGFQVEKVQGCGGKKEVLRGVKQNI
jgi:tRNA 5-methylaminomethyl-2-thiouridine biosynthesis bifunctional protein